MTESNNTPTRQMGIVAGMWYRLFRWRLTTCLLFVVLIAIGISALSLGPVRNARLRAYGCELVLDRTDLSTWQLFVSMLLPDDLVYPLKTLTYDGTAVDPQNRMPLSALSYCSEVENLRLVGLKPGELSKLSHLPNLKSLSVVGSSVNPADIAGLSLQPELEQLHLTLCKLRGEPSQTEMASSNVVKYLRIENSTIEPRSIPILVTFTQMEELLTVQVEFKDEHWLRFPPLPNLHLMQMRICSTRPLPAGVDKKVLFPKMRGESPYY